MKTILKDLVVFPSPESTIQVISDDKEIALGYPNPCHNYEIQNCIGFQDGMTAYHNSSQNIQFVQKNPDGSIVPGVQSEQLALVLLHRLQTMNKLFPCEENDLQIAGLKMYLAGCELRVRNRIARGVMGELKK